MLLGAVLNLLASVTSASFIALPPLPSEVLFLLSSFTILILIIILNTGRSVVQCVTRG